MALPKDLDDEGHGNEEKREEQTGQGKLKVIIPVIYIIIGGIAVSAFFAGYFVALMQQTGYKDGYDRGYSEGYETGVEDVFNFNTLPDKWVTLDAKRGRAIVNGTDLVFVWQEGNNSQNQILAFQTSTSFESGTMDATLYLMSDPITLPPDLADRTGLKAGIHYVLTDTENNTYVLKRLGED